MICSECGKESQCKIKRTVLSVKVREDIVDVECEVQSCIEEDSSKIPKFVRVEAIKEYRKKHNLLDEKVICYYRNSYNYSYLELSEKTNIPPERLKLIEKGVIQNNSENISLKKVFEIK